MIALQSSLEYWSTCACEQSILDLLRYHLAMNHDVTNQRQVTWSRDLCRQIRGQWWCRVNRKLSGPSSINQELVPTSFLAPFLCTKSTVSHDEGIRGEYYYDYVLLWINNLVKNNWKHLQLEKLNWTKILIFSYFLFSFLFLHTQYSAWEEVSGGSLGGYDPNIARRSRRGGRNSPGEEQTNTNTMSISVCENTQVFTFLQSMIIVIASVLRRRLSVTVRCYQIVICVMFRAVNTRRS